MSDHSSSSSSDSSSDSEGEPQVEETERKSSNNMEKACSLISLKSPSSRLHTPCTNIPLSPYPSPLPSSTVYPNTPYPHPSYPVNYPSVNIPTSYPKSPYPSTCYPKVNYPNLSTLPSGYPIPKYSPATEKPEVPEPEPDPEPKPEPEEDHDKPKVDIDEIDDGMAKMMKYGTAEVFKGTVHPNADFSPDAAAEALKNAMEGLGTDEQPIIDIASSMSNTQRQQLAKVYKTMYGEDLVQQLLSELSGNFEEAIQALFQPKVYYDAWSLNNAISGLGTKDMVLIEILCTRTNSEIQEIVECYEKKFERNLEQDIMDDTSGYFKRLLVSCLQGNRDELSVEQMEEVLSKGPGCVIDEGKAKEDAEKLYQAGEGKIGTEEETFLSVMAVRHYYQLRATFDAYKEVSGNDIVDAVLGEFTGDEEDAFKALVMCARNRPEYFADRLYNSMKGAGTDDSTLIRVITSRSEIDLQNIKEVFEKKYGKTLLSFVEEDTSGDYKRLLASIVGA